MKYKNMSNQKPRELYLGQRIEDLEKMYNVPDLREKKPKMLCASAQKILERAEKAYEEGNEELAYISYMKYLRVVTVLSRDPDYIKDKKFYNAILGVSNPEKAITIAERLKLRLTERYKENDRNRKIQDIEDQEKIKQKIEEDRKKSADKKSTHFTKPVISKGMPDSDDVTITSQQLFTLLKERSHKIMILDIRPAKDFGESHITHRYCINVPKDIIAAGHSANVLEQSLPMESKKVWADRQSMDLIVLLDWSSTAVIPGEPLHLLRTILLRWDVKVHYKRSPVALERGYEDFLLRYPSMSTNPHVTTPSTNASLDDVLGEIDYPNTIEDIWKNEQMSLPTERQTYISTARPMYVPRNPSVDRSSKAAAIQTYTERARSMQYILDQQEKLVDSSLDVEKQRIKAEKDWEHVRSKTEKEERSELEQSDHQLREQEILSLLMQLENKQHDMELENQDLRNKLDVYRQKELEEAERIAEERDDKISSGGDTQSLTKESSEMSDEKNIIVRRHLEEKEERIRNVERQRDELDRRREAMESERKQRLAHARKNKKPTQADNEDYDGYTTPNDGDGIGINRSHSSPNIAQMEDDDEGTIPQFDRTTKPHKSTISSELPPARQRDFQPVWGQVGRGLTGLKNLGNTCYMNSIIQCLNNTCALAAYLCTGEYRSHVNRGQPTRGLIADELAAVLRALCSGQYRFIAIKDLRSVVGKHQSLFRGVEQQDSHEFLTILMDWLHDDLQFPIKQQEREGLAASERAWQEYTKCRESLVLRLFYGQMRSTVRCSVCGEESITYDSFSNLSLELPPNANRCSLGDCLRLYLNGEKIIGWNCPSCKDKRDATKKLDISRLPPVLVIHFKRFYVDPKDYMSNTYRKKQTYIDFPLENLDMRHFSLQSPHLAQRSLYNLYGVSNHYGSMEGGHYTAYCKSTNYGKWYKFDDHVVSEITPSDVKSSAAYILFYTSQVEVP